jgi:DNA-binding winged helix-turn-helix (wHTH) protein
MIYVFGDCELDTERFELRRAGAVQALEPQVFDLLLFLVRNPDRLISRDELFAAVWKGRIVSDATLSSRVKAARQVLGDDGHAQAFIRTVHGRGFRFVAAVQSRQARNPGIPPVAAPAAALVERSAPAALNWEEAYRDLTAAQVGQSANPADLEKLADAAWWTSRLDERMALLERAHELHLRDERPARAAMAAVSLAEQNHHMGAQSVASGWLRRAERLLQPIPTALEHGYLARLRGRLAFERGGQLDEAFQFAEQAYAIAMRFRDRDLEMLTLQDQGAVLVTRGEHEPGFALMEEAAAAAIGGELGAMATGRIYCNMIDVCMRLADYRRAAEWDQEAARWCDRVGHSSGFPGVCRTRRAEIRRLRGAWDEAEAEARRACRELERLRVFAAPAFYEVGEVCLGRGALGEAENAFRRAHELGRAPQPGLARLRLAEGKVAAADALVAEALASATLSRLDRARILPVRVEIALAAGNVEAARAAADELRAIAETYRTAAMEAAALGAEGAVRQVLGDIEGAIECLRAAAQLWSENGLPLEEARSRLALGAAYRAAGIHEVAAMEIEAASAGFERLGATLELRRATALSDPDAQAN